MVAAMTRDDLVSVWLVSEPLTYPIWEAECLYFNCTPRDEECREIALRVEQAKEKKPLIRMKRGSYDSATSGNI